VYQRTDRLLLHAFEDGASRLGLAPAHGPLGGRRATIVTLVLSVLEPMSAARCRGPRQVEVLALELARASATASLP